MKKTCTCSHFLFLAINHFASLPTQHLLLEINTTGKIFPTFSKERKVWGKFLSVPLNRVLMASDWCVDGKVVTASSVLVRGHTREIELHHKSPSNLWSNPQKNSEVCLGFYLLWFVIYRLCQLFSWTRYQKSEATKYVFRKQFLNDFKI